MSSSSKSPSYVPDQRLSFLVKYGSSLAAVLRRRMVEKNIKKMRTIIDPNNKAVEDIKKLKEELKTAKESVVPPSYSLDERGSKRVIERIEGRIIELIAVDSEHEQSYKDLLDELVEMKDNRRLNVDSQKPQASVDGTGSGSLYSSQVLPFDNNNDGFVEAFNKLRQKKGEVLLRCAQLAKVCISYDLFVPQNVEISKGVLINWLIGLDIVNDPLVGEQFLDDIIAEPSFNVFRSYGSSRIRLSKHFVKSLSSMEDESEIVIPYRVINVPEHKRHEVHDSPLIMINKSANKLNDKVFNIIDEAGFTEKIQHKTRGEVRVVHLGNFHRGMGHVVVMKDTFINEFDEFLKKEKGILFLSLQGMSRIHELPESVSKLERVRVLDLRSCQYLKSLPKDIGNLTNLICLDLSECYKLDKIPKGITKLTSLRQLLGFIVVSDNQSQPKDINHQFAEFGDLKNLSRLIKLTIRSRRMSFPTAQDFQTLNCMKELRKLKVAWVAVQSNPTAHTSRSDENDFYPDELPETLVKLELQAAPDSTASQLLSIISKRSRYCNLEKLYIRGGTLQTGLYPELYCFHYVRKLRLRYLPLLCINWNDFRLSFPNLSYLQIVECPKLIFFPCDENGYWLHQTESAGENLLSHI